MLGWNHSFVKIDLPPSSHTRHIINQHSPILLGYSFSMQFILNLFMWGQYRQGVSILYVLYIIFYIVDATCCIKLEFSHSKNFFQDYFTWACCVFYYCALFYVLTNIYISRECALSQNVLLPLLLMVLFLLECITITIIIVSILYEIDKMEHKCANIRGCEFESHPGPNSVVFQIWKNI